MSAINRDISGTQGEEFANYNLRHELLMGLLDNGFEKPSPIQEESIPMALTGHDILARAKNGTGKSAAFCIPALEMIDPDINVIQVAIVVPTRELALQTSQVCKELAKHMQVQIMSVTGGTCLWDDIVRLHQPVHLLVGTPGRILDLAKKGLCNLKNCHVLVMDEADKLLSSELQPFMDHLIKFFPQNRQILMYSATFPIKMKYFEERHMKNPFFIDVMDGFMLTGVDHLYAFVEERQKIYCLNRLFCKLQINQSIIFCNSAHRVERVAKEIIDLGFSCLYIHSKMLQDQRNKVSGDFRNGACRNLVCTDLFARGIDIPSVNVVINFDLPRSAETYLHRVGRTGRFGRLGLSLSLITYKEHHNLFCIAHELGADINQLPF